MRNNVSDKLEVALVISKMRLPDVKLVCIGMLVYLCTSYVLLCVVAYYRKYVVTVV